MVAFPFKTMYFRKMGFASVSHTVLNTDMFSHAFRILGVIKTANPRQQLSWCTALE